MFLCPTCHIPLKTVQGTPGVFWWCPSCDGRSATIALLRKHIPADIVNTLWQSAKAGMFPRRRTCPGCGNLMAEVPVTAAQQTRTLDICTLCHVVWFDSGEYTALPVLQKKAGRYDGLPQEAREKLALLDIEIAREEAQNRDFGDFTPETGWEWIAGTIGLPIELEAKTVRSAPLVTWGLALLIVIISAIAFTDLQTAVLNFGLIPAHLERYGGLTFLTSFLLHGGLFHLLGNIYFLMIFGDNVEDWLGKWRYLLLILFATLAGDIAHIMSDARPDTPCIGASGGISGIIAFYALTFPHVRIGILMRYFANFRWISMPAYVMFFIWVLLQFVGAWKQLYGFSDVSAFAHLGGAGVGFLFWLTSKKNVRT